MIQAIQTVCAGQCYLSSNVASQVALEKINAVGKTPVELLSTRETIGEYIFDPISNVTFS